MSCSFRNPPCDSFATGSPESVMGNRLLSHSVAPSPDGGGANSCGVQGIPFLWWALLRGTDVATKTSKAATIELAANRFPANTPVAKSLKTNPPVATHLAWHGRGRRFEPDQVHQISS